ncbi:major capsid protein [Schinkia azotoformans]|uniref:major capsid protein n=1 Tax=Schinkia azotoformans TaxID=1454 RepID=UPI002DBFE0A9|nr:major capsid protein [Schinkia azotoformans]MEC1714756.1 major capsid protein [Schinkia azotoformans]MEC1757488.1 major capsid protein [Schinkia azotoformans]
MPVEILGLEQALSSEELIVYSRNLATPQNYLHEILFPARETSELNIDIVREGSRLPVMAQIAELGTQVEYGSREGMTGQRIEIPKIQRGRAMDEKLVRTLLQGSLRNNEVAEIRRTQLNDADYAVDSIKARKEWIAMQSITTGGVTYSEGGVQLSVDFGFTAEQKPVLSGTDLWSDTANSNPLDDIMGWVNTFADKGITLPRALASRQVISYLLQNKNLRIAYHGDPSGTANPPQLNKAQLDELFASQGLPKIVAYDTQARTENKALSSGKLAFTNVRMAPQNRFVMLPDGPLGHYLWAESTEEMMSDIQAEATDSNGIYVFRKINEHPIRVETIGVNLAFPSLGLNDSVVTATVL